MKIFIIPSFKINILSSKHDEDILQISYVPISCTLLLILFILCFINFLLSKTFSCSSKSIDIFIPLSVLMSYPFSETIQYIFYFNPISLLIGIPLKSSSIFPNVLFVESKNFDLYLLKSKYLYLKSHS